MTYSTKQDYLKCLIFLYYFVLMKERKQALLRRTAEREAKLEQAKSKKMCNTGTSSYVFSICCIQYLSVIL